MREGDRNWRVQGHSSSRAVSEDGLTGEGGGIHVFGAYMYMAAFQRAPSLSRRFEIWVVGGTKRPSPKGGA